MRKIGLALALTALLLANLALPAAATANDAWIALLDKTVTAIDHLAMVHGELTVTGTASIAVEPDRATIELGVVYEAATPVEAQEQVNTVMLGVINAVMALGVPENKLVTSGYSIYPAYEYTQNPPMPRGYQVSSTVLVEVEQFDLIALIIDRAVEAGANQVQSIAFDTSRRSDIYREALVRAVAAAQGKAGVMATAAGQRLGVLRGIIETEPDNSMYLNTFDARAVSARQSTQIIGGEINVTARVTLVFEIQ
jgi:uncharacterized protein YggE